MHRVKAHDVRTGEPRYIDLDQAPLIVNGVLNETEPDGTIKKTYSCTIVYLSAIGQNGRSLCEYLRETPPELFCLPVWPWPVDGQPQERMVANGTDEIRTALMRNLRSEKKPKPNTRRMK